MYTWGYIKDVILAKLNMSEAEAKNNGFLNRFIMYANECITQISNTIRPKQSVYTLETFTKEDWDKMFDEEWKKIIDNWQDSKWFEDEESFDLWLTIHKEDIENEIKNVILKGKVPVNTICEMPEDYINYNGHSLVFQKQEIIKAGYDYHEFEKIVKTELNPENITYIGERKFIPLVVGKYVIEYDARWFEFLETIQDAQELDIPFDVLECIPPYVAAQCWFIDDIQRSAMFTNEYEKAFARINSADYRDNNHFVSEGGW